MQETKSDIKNNNFVIGVVGGMGSYATLSFFERYLKKFPANKEWERPRIIIDNRCTMPSRVRALLYNEKKEVVLSEIHESICQLINMGGPDTKIILACNTSHVFVNEIVRNNPNLASNILHIIEETGKYLKKQSINNVYLIATEGTIDSNIYQDTLKKYDISVRAPQSEIYPQMRYFIELVKQHKITSSTIQEFETFLISLKEKNIILGCTEFSALTMSQLSLPNIRLIDPLEIALNLLHELWLTHSPIND